MSSDSPITAPPARIGRTSPLTLGAELERDRLVHRVRTMSAAIDVLRRRASEQRRETGGPPRHLRRALSAFEAQIEAINAQLQDLAPERVGLRISNA